MRLECVRVQRRTKAGSLALLLARSYQFAVAYGLHHLFFGGGLLYRFLVRCSYLEIYCEDVKDLLGDVTKNLSVSSVP